MGTAQSAPVTGAVRPPSVRLDANDDAPYERAMLAALDAKKPLPVRAVGGKSASLMRLYGTPGVSSYVPGGYAITVDFFAEWTAAVTASREWAAAEPKLGTPEGPRLCVGLKRLAQRLPLSAAQTACLDTVRRAMEAWPGRLAAVRSSAPEEDGTGASFAGVFETKLGVSPEGLEAAVRACFASVFDHRVFSYAGAHKPAFAATVMEMVDAATAGVPFSANPLISDLDEIISSLSIGVAFSANPLNSDLDEMLVDAGYGLGECFIETYRDGLR